MGTKASNPVFDGVSRWETDRCLNVSVKVLISLRGRNSITERRASRIKAEASPNETTNVGSKVIHLDCCLVVLSGAKLPSKAFFLEMFVKRLEVSLGCLRWRVAHVYGLDEDVAKIREMIVQQFSFISV